MWVHAQTAARVRSALLTIRDRWVQKSGLRTRDKRSCGALTGVRRCGIRGVQVAGRCTARRIPCCFVTTIFGWNTRNGHGYRGSSLTLTRRTVSIRGMRGAARTSMRARTRPGCRACGAPGRSEVWPGDEGSTRPARGGLRVGFRDPLRRIESGRESVRRRPARVPVSA
jgi:hypothetical protein